MGERLDRRRLRPLRGCTRLVVVAHPDDETLWAGATIAAHPGTGVLCLTNREVRPRRAAFEQAMRALGARGVILDVPDRRAEPPASADEARIRAVLAAVLADPSVEVVLTHGPEGEYGHVMHQRVSTLVTEQANVLGRGLWYFDFDEGSGLGMPSSKAAALSAYFPPDSDVPESDRQHMQLSAMERPCPASEYRGASPAIATVYGGGA